MGYELFYKEEENGELTITGITSKRKRIATLYIPKTHDGKNVTKIGDKAFKGVSIIYALIPETIKEIGNGAFFGCYLTGFGYVGEAEDLKLGKYAFAHNLINTLPMHFNVKVIPEGCFYQNTIKYLYLNKETRVEALAFDNNPLKRIQRGKEILV